MLECSLSNLVGEVDDRRWFERAKRRGRLMRSQWVENEERTSSEWAANVEGTRGEQGADKEQTRSERKANKKRTQRWCFKPATQMLAYVSERANIPNGICSLIAPDGHETLSSCRSDDLIRQPPVVHVWDIWWVWKGSMANRRNVAVSYCQYVKWWDVGWLLRWFWFLEALALNLAGSSTPKIDQKVFANLENK